MMQNDLEFAAKPAPSDKSKKIENKEEIKNK